MEAANLYQDTHERSKNERPPAGVYMIIEAILVLGLSYIIFISQARNLLGVRLATQVSLG